jgi:L-lysine exporter family protein LysE/ArgO
MLFAYSTGLLLSLSLILAIGPQNAFVLRQGILRQHVWPTVLFCAVADTALIITGVFGLPLLIADLVEQIRPWLFGGAGAWLFGYGVLRVCDLFDNRVLKIDVRPVISLWATLGAAAAITFINPHVYLDTVVLIGTISLQFNGVNKLAFGAGAATASFVFFAALGYGSYLLSDIMLQPRVWQILNVLIAVFMFVMSAAMLRAGGWY